MSYYLLCMTYLLINLIWTLSCAADAFRPNQDSGKRCSCLVTARLLLSGCKSLRCKLSPQSNNTLNCLSSCVAGFSSSWWTIILKWIQLYSTKRSHEILRQTRARGRSFTTYRAILVSKKLHAIFMSPLHLDTTDHR